MTDLRSLQEKFQAHLLEPRTENAIYPWINSSAKADAQTRLGVYVDAYRLRLLEALETDFPVLKMLMGDEDFDHLGRVYLDAHPSQHYSLRWFSQHMPAFLRNTLPYNEQPVLAEMAAFEWGLNLAFDASDDPLTHVEDMAAVPPSAWANMQLLPHASVQRLDLAWNVVALWKAAQANQGPIAAEAAPHLLAWILWRKERQTYFRSLTPDEAWALDAVISGQDFSTLCTGLCEWVDTNQVAAYAASLLKRWITDGMISKLCFT